MSRRSKLVDSSILELTKHLADEKAWNWRSTTSQRDAADAVLHKMAELGLIKHKDHPLGGDIWIVGDQIFGRTDSLPKSYSRYKVAKAIA